MMPLRVDWGSWNIISRPPERGPSLVPAVKVQARAMAVTIWSSVRPSNLPVATAAPSVP